MSNLIYLVQGFISDTFERKVGKWQGKLDKDGQPTDKKALIVSFQTDNLKIRMLLHASANYVGVYLNQAGDRVWDCVCYHDSCWRTDGIESFLKMYQDNLHLCFFPNIEEFYLHETIVRGMHVVKLTDEQVDELHEIRKLKFS